MTWHRAARRLSTLVEWRTAVLALLCLAVAVAILNASSLPASSSTAHATHRTALLVVSGSWALMAVGMLARRELRRHEPTAVLVLATLLIGAYGTVVPDDDWRWQCITTLVVLTALPRMHHRGWRVLALVLFAQATALALLFQTELRGEYLVYSAGVVAILVAAPAVVVSAMASALDRVRADAERAARTDALTGLLNRRGLADDVPKLLRRSAEQGSRVAVLLLDLDHFKRVNDTWGHSAGDRLLQAVATGVQAGLRGSDLVARWGGEELLVVTDVPDEAQLTAVAGRVRRSVASLLVAGLPPVTVSIGTAAAPTTVPVAEGQRSPSTSFDLVAGLIDQADEALYAAKAAGRDRVHHHRAASPAPSAGGPPVPVAG